MSNTPVGKDDDGREFVVVSYYAHCGILWTETWDCDCNGSCPVCGTSDIESYDHDINYLPEEAAV